VPLIAWREGALDKAAYWMNGISYSPVVYDSSELLYFIK
jgi:hypothetical protein